MIVNRYIINGKVNENATWRDAWRITDPGASNPVAVAGTLAQASSALLRKIGTDGVKKHPCDRSDGRTVSSLYNVNAIGTDYADYEMVRDVIDILNDGKGLTRPKYMQS